MRNGILESSQGVIFPTVFPALDVIAAKNSGPKVKSTIKNPLFCRIFKISPRRKRKITPTIQTMEKSGMRVLPEVITAESESFAGRGVSFDKSTVDGGDGGSPIICFFSAE